MNMLPIHLATPIAQGRPRAFALAYDFWSPEPVPARERTEVTVRYDAGGLVVSFRCLDGLPGQARAAATRRGDPELWRDDGIEIYVDPAGGADGFRKFAFNIRGVQAECRQSADGSLDPAGPGTGWSVALRTLADGWDAEVRLPVAVLGAAPRPGALWRFAICRFAHAGERRSGTSSPGASHNHPEAFGYLYCADAGHPLAAERIVTALENSRFADGLLLPIDKRAVLTRDGRVETGDLPESLSRIMTDLNTRLEASRLASDKGEATRTRWTALWAQAQRLLSDPDGDLGAERVVHAHDSLLPRILDLELRLALQQPAGLVMPPAIFLPHGRAKEQSFGFIGQDVIAMRPGELWLFTNYGRPPTDFAGKSGDFTDPTILISRDGGRSWGEPRPMGLRWPIDGLMSDGGKSVLRLRSGTVVFIAHRNGSTHRTSGSHGLPAVSRSIDDGRTWSPARLIVDEADGIDYVMNQRLVQLASGRLVLAISRACPGAYHEGQGETVGQCYLSDDEGLTWHRSRDAVRHAARYGVQEPLVVQCASGALLMLFRCSSGSHHASFSRDDGETWSAPIPTPLRAAISPLTALTLADGRIVVVYNHNHPLFPNSYYPRNPLVYATTRDGRIWTEPVLIDDQPGQQLIYPSITPTDEGVLIVYSAHVDPGDGGFTFTDDHRTIGGGKAAIITLPDDRGN